jgi:signal transduction histidine kinase
VERNAAMINSKLTNLIASTASVLAMTVVGIMSIMVQNKSEQSVAETYEVKAKIMQVYQLLRDTESRQRGYLITGNETYLGTALVSQDSIKSLLSSLKAHTTSSPVQQRNFQSLQQFSTTKLNEIVKVAELYRAGKKQEALEIMNTDVGERVMNQIGKAKDAMLAEEDRLLLKRQAKSNWLQLISLMLLSLGVVGAAISIYSLYKQVSPLITELSSTNDSLQKSIAEKQREIELRKRLESRNKLLIDRLTSKNAELNHFAYIASHDLQEPLRTVNNFIEVFREDYGEKLGEDAHQYFDFILGATHRMKALIEGLLNYSRLGKSRGAELLNLNDVLGDTMDNLAAAIAAKNAVVKIGKMPTTAFCMKTETTQLFQNLINNAIKYTASGVVPKITVQAKDVGDAWEFCVTDNGIGIPAMQQEKIFNMFSRLHGEGEYLGQGIGLAFCKKIVELHGGKIWVESEPGQGSKFYFTFSKSVKDEAEIEQNFIN